MLERKRQICYWNPEKRIVGTSTVTLEAYLKLLGNVQVTEISTLDDENLASCDLLLIAAEYIPPEDFQSWLRKLVKKVQIEDKVWIPALIFSDITFSFLGNILHEIAETNWYFDIISARHLNSLPMRVANLFRIHDHLLELIRYDTELQDLGKKIAVLEEETKLLKARSNIP